MFKQMINGPTPRMIAKGNIISCVFSGMALELLVCSDQAPDGMYMTFPICMLMGMGMILVSIMVSILYMLFIEHPFAICVKVIDSKWL